MTTYRAESFGAGADPIPSADSATTLIRHALHITPDRYTSATTLSSPFDVEDIKPPTTLETLFDVIPITNLENLQDSYVTSSGVISKDAEDTFFNFAEDNNYH